MSVEKNYQTEDTDDMKVVSSDVTKPQDDQIYRKIALLDALISPGYNYESDTCGKLLIHYIPILDYVIPHTSIFKLDKPPYRAGNTILHVAKSIGELEICETLIEIGADYTIKDKYGSPLLHLDVESEHSNYFNFKIDEQMPEDKKFIEKVFSAHIDFENTDNPSDKNGISHFHMACMYNKIELVKLFLDNGISVHEAAHTDSPIYSGFTPLHFAVKYCAVETVELLLNYGANPSIKNSRGLNPMHLLIDEKLNTWNQLRRRQVAGDKDNPKYSYSNLEIFHNKIEKIITLLLEKNIEHGFGAYDDTGLSHIHVICTMEDTSIVEKFLDRHEIDLEGRVHENSALWSSYTALHFAAHFNADTVRLLLRKGADLGAKDARGLTPFDICLNCMSITDIHSIYSLFSAWKNIQFSDAKTKLADFIWTMQDPNVFEAFLRKNVDDVNMFIPFDSPICAGYTPLHLSLICREMPRNSNPEDVDYSFRPQKKDVEYTSRIIQCIIEGANPYAQDAHGSTPIHLAFNLQEIVIVCSLFATFKTFFNVVDEHGLSVLHVACAAGQFDVPVVDRLLSLGSNVNEATVLSYPWYVIDETVVGINDKALYKTIPKGSTPLHIAVIVECPEIVEFLIDHNADLLAKDVDSMTPLERSLGTSIFGNVEDVGWEFRNNPMSDGKKRILEILIARMSDLFADTRADRMLYSYSLLGDELLSRLLIGCNKSMRKILNSAGITMLHVACFNKNLQQIRELLQDGIDVNSRVDLTSPLWPGCTPLHILMKYRGYEWITQRDPEYVQITSLLLERGADVAAKDVIGSTPLHLNFQLYLTNRSNVLFFDMMLDHIVDFNVNPINAKGLSHLHAASVRDKAFVVEKLLEHGADVNQAVDYFDNFYGGFTALHFAAAFQSEKAVSTLLRYGADVHRKDVFGGNPLHAAAPTKTVRRPCVDLLRNLIRAGINMELRNAFGEKPLEKLIKSNTFTIEEVKLFVEHGCHVNVWNPLSEEGLLAIALRESDTKSIFDIFIEASTIKNIDKKNGNAIHNVVSYEVDWEWFDDDDPIDEVFIPAEKYTMAIKTLTDLGVNINHQNNQGKTPLHVAAEKQNITGIIGLLNNGANINIVDGYGETAFARSLEASKFDDEMTQLDAKILAIISAHMFKLKLVRIDISQSNREVWQEIGTIIPFDTDWCQECCREFDKMKSRNIDVYPVTLKDFLSDTGAVSCYPHMLPDERKAVDEFFECQSDVLKQEFPNLAYLLLAQYRKATARVHLIQPAEVSIDFLVDFPMPSVCSRIILKFLSNDVLEKLIASKNT